jgi:predicted extracellular nuclease
MRVAVPRPVAVSAMQTYNERSSELFVLPDLGGGIADGRRTSAGGILLQSGPENLGSQNPERIQIQLDAALVPGPVPPVAVGDTLADVIGVLRYDYGNYEVAATEPIAVTPRPYTGARTRLGRREGTLTIATYNVLNLSPTAEDSLQRRLLGRQLVDALGAPEIVALQEIQDASGERDDGVTDATPTLRALIDAVRAAGGPAYRAFDVPPTDGRPGGAPGGNIRNAFLYDPGSVRLVGYFSLTAARLTKAGIRHAEAFRESRDPLLAEFDVGGGRIVLINNHLTSRYGSTPTYGAVQPFVQAGEEERGRQTRALNAYAADLLRRRPDVGVVVLGDMNTFEFTDDLAALLPGRPPLLHPLIIDIPLAQRYSYNYEGNSQTLDHVFVSESLRSGAEVEIVHLNTDRPTVPGQVASDHDPVVVRLRR